MKRLSILCALMSAAAFTATAQSYNTGGSVITTSDVTPFDMVNLSQTQFQFGTARAAAMAGAFTSLGADLSAMSINPAGLGMYRHNDVSISPMLVFSSSPTSGKDVQSFEKDSKTRFSMSNLGFSLKVYEGTGAVTAVNFGFGYNKIADFNYRYSFASQGLPSSIADVFARQLDNGGFKAADLSSDNGFGWGRVDPAYWGATLGYKTGMVNTLTSGGTVWARDMIGEDAIVDQFSTVDSRGSIGEFDLSVGINFSSKFYLGATLGFQSVYVRRDTYYGENYSYDADPNLNYQMEYVNYDQRSVFDGMGVNFKIGAIYRPFENLRIGVALHTPTFYSVDYKYYGGMTSQNKINNNVDNLAPTLSDITDTLIDSGRDSWDFTSPTRLMFGVSYTLLQRMILSVDYERDWYQNISVKNSPYGDNLYDNFVDNYFKGANTLRAGVEFKLLPAVALRAGYGYSGSMLKDNGTIFSSPIIYKTQYAACGVGFQLGKVISLDVTYQHSTQHLTQFNTFYYSSDSDATDYSQSPLYKTKINKNSVIATLGFHF